MLTGHGDDRHKYQFPIRADFSSNVVPGNVSKTLLSHLQDVLPWLNHYPEPDAASLANALAGHYQLKAENVLVTNGSVEAFYLLAQHFKGSKSLIFCPSFAEYEDACRIFEHETTFLPIDDFGVKPSAPGLLNWLGNPNNPDGKVTSCDKIKNWLQTNPESFLVVDEAYVLLCAGFQSSIPLLDEFPNLVVIHSFTKTFAIPGLRMGFILASAKLIAELTKLKMPWSVNYLAIEAGKFILKNYESMLPDLSRILANSQRLQNEIAQLPGLKVIPSATNYFLLETEKESGAELKAFLLGKHGILVRDAGNFRCSEKNKVRIAVQDENDNQLLIEALKEWTHCS